MKCGLLGRKLGHSYSPQIHSLLGNYHYDLIEVEPELLKSALDNTEYTGFNVTIPYKKAVIPFCDTLSPVAQRLGAVNTIVRRRDGSLIGHNTDYFGFQTMVESTGLQVSGKKVLVLGSGGASNTVCAVMEQLGANVIVISRSGDNNYGNIHLHSDAAVIVNATPVGMYPAVGISPVDLAAFPMLEGVLDVIYNPARTQLLLDAEKRGLITANGLLMLVAQAKESAEWFTGSTISDEQISRIHGILKQQMENIVLIGMPGCGKSTVGKLLAESLNKQFIDADDEIVAAAGKPIPRIFAEDGESVFRNWESQILEKLGKQSGLIIATGGGCVTQNRNYPLLHQNGTVFWIGRNIEQLPTDGRPLSQATRLQDMFRVREPMYRAFADHYVDNNGSVEKTVSKILSLWEGEQ